jgi:ParB family chromosome partitioning protein
MNDQNREVLELEINLLQPNPLQPRGMIVSDTLNELVESIRIHGILEPLVVAKTPAGYQIIAGERRWKAAKTVGLKAVPVIIKETTPRGMLEMALVENVQREDLNPLDRAQAYKRLLEEFNLATSEIAIRVSKSASYISNTLRLLLLPDAIKDGLFSGIVTEGHARALLQLNDIKLMIDGYKQILRLSMSVRQTEEMVRRMQNTDNKGPKTRIEKILSPRIDEMERSLSKIIHGRVRISQSQVEAKIALNFRGDLSVTNEKLDKIYEMIKKIFS